MHAKIIYAPEQHSRAKWDHERKAIADLFNARVPCVEPRRIYADGLGAMCRALLDLAAHLTAAKMPQERALASDPLCGFFVRYRTILRAADLFLMTCTHRLLKVDCLKPLAAVCLKLAHNRDLEEYPRESDESSSSASANHGEKKANRSLNAFEISDYDLCRLPPSTWNVATAANEKRSDFGQLNEKAMLYAFQHCTETLYLAFCGKDAPRILPFPVNAVDALCHRITQTSNSELSEVPVPPPKTTMLLIDRMVGSLIHQHLATKSIATLLGESALTLNVPNEVKLRIALVKNVTQRVAASANRSSSGHFLTPPRTDSTRSDERTVSAAKLVRLCVSGPLPKRDQLTESRLNPKNTLSQRSSSAPRRRISIHDVPSPLRRHPSPFART